MNVSIKLELHMQTAAITMHIQGVNQNFNGNYSKASTYLRMK